jgi:DNA repair protein RadC
MKKMIMNPELAQEDGKNYENRIPMRYWAEDDLPRQKLLLKGNGSLSDAELLSIIIGSGVSGENSLDIAMKTLSICGNNLCEFWKFSVSDLQKIKGIGEKRAVKIAAMFALARRRNESEVIFKNKISKSQDAFEIFHSLMGDLPYEEFWLLLLNRANRVVKKVKISEGGISGTVVDPKKIFQICLEQHATSIILGHNHPSGAVTPSEADNKITKKIKDCGLLLDVAVLDHIIVGDDRFYSFADEGAI